MRFFRKIEITKPKKQEKGKCESLSNGSIKPLKNSETQFGIKPKKEEKQIGKVGIKNEGFDLKEELKDDELKKKTKEEENRKELKHDKIENHHEETQKEENKMGENRSDCIDEMKDEISVIRKEPERRYSRRQQLYKRIEKILNHPRIIHWVSLCLIGLAVWSIIYSIAGSKFLPGSQLFSLLILFVLAFVGGELIKLLKLPPLLGMLLVGLLLRNVGFIHLKGVFVEVTATLREIALCIILIRAGLGLDPKALKSLSLVILRLASVPGVIEGTITTIVTHFLLGLPWLWGAMTGAILAAVSPAVVIPCLFSLQERGYGTGKGIPTLVVAAASLDDIFAITVFGIILNVIFSTDTSVTMQILQGPLGILLGIVFGIVWGFVANFVPHPKDKQVVLLRVLMIVGGGLMAIIGSRAIGYQGAGPLGCIIAAFVACLGWRNQDYTEVYNPVANVFRVIWLVFQPILFGLIGSEVDVSVLEFSTIGHGLIALFCSLLGRIVVTVFIGYGVSFNWKEKTFIALAWFPKATVQAALGPLALDTARRQGTDDDIAHARKILILAVLSILITAPIGAALITTLGPKLLTKKENDSKGEQQEMNDATLEHNREHNR